MKLQWTNFWPFAEKSWTICQETLDHMPRNPGPSAENANKSSAICQDCQGPSAENANKSLAICQECQQILGHLPRLPRTICRECQQILGHLPRLPRTAIKISLPRMPSLPWLALAASSFGSLGSRQIQKLNLPRPAKALPMNLL